MIEINLPWIDSSLLPNRANGRKWQARINAKKDARIIGSMATQSASLLYGWEPSGFDRDYAVHIIFYPANNPGPDVDGVLSAMKPMLDGIASALCMNDRHFNPITITRGPVENGGRIRVIIDELPFTD